MVTYQARLLLVLVALAYADIATLDPNDIARFQSELSLTFPVFKPVIIPGASPLDTIYRYTVTATEI